MPLRLFSGTDIAETVRRSNCIVSTVFGTVGEVSRSPAGLSARVSPVAAVIARCQTVHLAANRGRTEFPRIAPLRLEAAALTTAVRQAHRLDIKQ
jgi:hypothetical protein